MAILLDPRQLVGFYQQPGVVRRADPLTKGDVDKFVRWFTPETAQEKKVFQKTVFEFAGCLTHPNMAKFVHHEFPRLLRRLSEGGVIPITFIHDQFHDGHLSQSIFQVRQNALVGLIAMTFDAVGVKLVGPRTITPTTVAQAVDVDDLVARLFRQLFAQKLDTLLKAAKKGETEGQAAADLIELFSQIATGMMEAIAEAATLKDLPSMVREWLNRSGVMHPFTLTEQVREVAHHLQFLLAAATATGPLPSEPAMARALKAFTMLKTLDGIITYSSAEFYRLWDVVEGQSAIGSKSDGVLGGVRVFRLRVAEQQPFIVAGLTLSRTSALKDKTIKYHVQADPDISSRLAPLFNPGWQTVRSDEMCVLNDSRQLFITAMGQPMTDFAVTCFKAADIDFVASVGPTQAWIMGVLLAANLCERIEISLKPKDTKLSIEFFYFAETFRVDDSSVIGQIRGTKKWEDVLDKGKLGMKLTETSVGAGFPWGGQTAYRDPTDQWIHQAEPWDLHKDTGWQIRWYSGPDEKMDTASFTQPFDELFLNREDIALVDNSYIVRQQLENAAFTLAMFDKLPATLQRRRAASAYGMIPDELFSVVPRMLTVERVRQKVTGVRGPYAARTIGATAMWLARSVSLLGVGWLGTSAPSRNDVANNGAAVGALLMQKLWTRYSATVSHETIEVMAAKHTEALLRINY